MQYPPRLAFSAVWILAVAACPVAACGDNRDASPDATGDPDGPPAATCRLDLEPGDLAGGAWDERFTIPGVGGMDGIAPTVFDFARDVDGSLVAAGKFDYLGKDRVAPLLRWRSGAWEPARATWELTPPGAGFSAIAIAPDGKLALATYDNFAPYDGEIWLDDGTGLRVIGRYQGNLRRLAWFGGKLWAGGWMELAISPTAVSRGLAVWNGTGWNRPPGGATQAFVHELVVDGNELLVGGDFTQLGGIAARGVAAYNGTAWRALSFPSGVAVYALARGPDNTLYAGGAFGDLGGGDAAGGIARWTGTTWVKVGGGVGNGFFPGVVTSLASHDGSLFAAGCFGTVGGGFESPAAQVAIDVARWDGAWHSLDGGTRGVNAAWIEPRSCGDSGPGSVWEVSKQRLFSDGDRLLLAGSFSGIDGVMSQALIAYDGAAWRPQGPTTGVGIGGSIDRLGVAGDTCEAWGYGQLSHVNGEPVPGRVVRFDGERWVAIPDSIPRTAYCPAFSVSPKGGDVVLGCLEAVEGGKEVGRLYRVSGDQLVQVGGELPLVFALEHDATGRLWVGGGGATGFVGRMDGDQLVMIEEGFDGSVGFLDPGEGDDVIAGGYFTKVGAVDAPKLARWNGTAWRALGSPKGTITAIAHDADRVYASSSDDGEGFMLLGSFDGAAWTDLGSAASGITPHRFFNFNALRIVGDAILAAGSAVRDDETGRGAFVYRNGQFTPLGGGVHGIQVIDLAISHEAVWVGGVIAEVGEGAAAKSSVGVARLAFPR